MAAFFAVLWFVTLMWGLHRAPGRRGATGDAPPAPPPPRGDLRRALSDGDLGTIADALCASVVPPAPDVDALRLRLADPAQRDALDVLQRARWAGGDPRAARDAIREAFAKGPRVHAPADAPRVAPLPPLYPPA